MTSPKLSLQITVWIAAQPCQPFRETSLKYVFLKECWRVFPYSSPHKWACGREGTGPSIPLLSLFGNLIPSPDNVRSEKIVLEDSLKKKAAGGDALVPVSDGTEEHGEVSPLCPCGRRKGARIYVCEGGNEYRIPQPRSLQSGGCNYNMHRTFPGS